MKRRVMIAKALSHEPQILFLDEPTAGVDVELRRDMWEMVRGLRESGVTIILTTHYIEEAEEMADRIGVISKGEIILVEDKAALMNKLGKKQLTLSCRARWPPSPQSWPTIRWSCPTTARAHLHLRCARANTPASAELLRRLDRHGIDFKDLHSSESSLEEIFVSLVRKRP